MKAWTLIAVMLSVMLSGALAAAPAAAGPLAESLEEYFAFQDPGTGVITPDQMASLNRGDYLLIDVRGAEAFLAGHIRWAENIPWDEVMERRARLTAHKKTVLYCDTGVQSAQLMLALRLLGARGVTVLRGGYHGWLAAGEPPAR